MSTTELRRIQRKLDTWELDHLRELAADLHTQLEAAQTEIQRLERELQSADACAMVWQGMAADLQEKCQAQFGITRDGQMGVLR